MNRARQSGLLGVVHARVRQPVLMLVSEDRTQKRETLPWKVSER